MSETYRRKADEMPRGCPKCGCEAVYMEPEVDEFDSSETRYYECLECRFVWGETWQFVKWEKAERAEDEEETWATDE